MGETPNGPSKAYSWLAPGAMVSLKKLHVEAPSWNRESRAPGAAHRFRTFSVAY